MSDRFEQVFVYLRAFKEELIDWSLVWAVLSIAVIVLLPPQEGGTPALLAAWFEVIGLSAGIVFLMAATLRLFQIVNRLFYYTQAVLAALIVATFYGPFFNRISQTPGALRDLAGLGAFTAVFGLAVLCYLWLWRRQIKRNASVADLALGQQTELDGSDLLYVDWQSGSLRVHTTEGTQIWPVQFKDITNLLDSFQGAYVAPRYWVADHAVNGLGLNRQGQMVLYLSDNSFAKVADDRKGEIGFRYRHLFDFEGEGS